MVLGEQCSKKDSYIMPLADHAIVVGGKSVIATHDKKPEELYRFPQNSDCNLQLGAESAQDNILATRESASVTGILQTEEAGRARDIS
jgi:hypothetical protein